MDNISILITEKSNMESKYFYENISKEEERSINEDTIKNSIDFIKMNSDRGRYNIKVYGGEPLIREDLIEQLLVYSTEKLDEKIYLSIFTNGTLYNENIKNIIEKYEDDVKITFQIFLEGKKKVHNLNRRMKDGSGSFDKIVENINKYSNLVDFIRIKSILNPDNIKHFYDSFVYFKENILYDYVGFEFDYDVNVEFDKENVKEYEIEMEKVFEEIKDWIKEEGKDVVRKVAPFSRAFFDINSDVVCGIGYKSLVIDVNGDMYPCFIALKNGEYLLGNINENNYNLENDVLNIYERPYSCYNDDYCKLKCNSSGNCSMCIKRGLDDRSKIERESKQILCDLKHINYEYIEKLREYIKREDK